MALWAGTAINTNETAMVFNKLANKKAIAMVRDKNAFTYAVLGKEETGSTPGSSTGFQRLKQTTGKDVEVKLLGELATPATAADSTQVDAATVTWNDNMFGAAVFPYAHYSNVFPIPESELDRFRGDELKTLNYLDEFFDYAMLSYENVWGTAFGKSSSLAEPSRTVLGSYVFAIAGNNTGAVDWANNGSTYGTINRADSANVDFRGNYYGAQGDLTLPKIRTAKNACVVKGYKPSFAVAAETVYGKVEQLVEAYSQVTYDKQWSEFGGEYVRYAGMAFALDPYAASGQLAIMTPETWLLYMNSNQPFTSTGVVKDVTKIATYVLHTTFWMQLVCKAPCGNAILTGITS